MSNMEKTKPLMYIVQPDLQEVKAQMQEFVVKKARKKEASIHVETVDHEVVETKEELSTEENKNELEITDIQNEEQEIKNEDQETKKEEKTKRQRKTRKPISQMSIVEKVEFFSTLPKNMPRSLCLIETAEDSYRGVIMSEEEGTVTIRSLNHPKPIDIPIENIHGINVLGF